MTDAPTEIKVSELVVDTKWAISVVQICFGQGVVLTIDHPRHGPLHTLFNGPSLITLRDWLNGNFPPDRVTQ